MLQSLGNSIGVDLGGSNSNSDSDSDSDIDGPESIEESQDIELKVQQELQSNFGPNKIKNGLVGNLKGTTVTAGGGQGKGEASSRKSSKSDSDSKGKTNNATKSDSDTDSVSDSSHTATTTCASDDINCKMEEATKVTVKDQKSSNSQSKPQSQTVNQDFKEASDVPTTAFATRKEIEFVLDGLLTDVKNAFSRCAIEDDSYELPLLNRMQLQRNKARSCLFGDSSSSSSSSHSSEAENQQSKAVSPNSGSKNQNIYQIAIMLINALEYLYGEIPETASEGHGAVQIHPYFRDLITDLKLELKDFNKQKDELYYWHGPKRTIPTQLSRLVEHWKVQTLRAENFRIEVPSLSTAIGPSRGAFLAQNEGGQSANGVPLIGVDLEDFEKFKRQVNGNGVGISGNNDQNDILTRDYKDIVKAFERHAISTDFEYLVKYRSTGQTNSKTSSSESSDSGSSNTNTKLQFQDTDDSASREIEFKTFLIDEKLYPSLAAYKNSLMGENSDLSKVNLVLFPISWLKPSSNGGGEKNLVEWMMGSVIPQSDSDNDSSNVKTLFGIASPNRCLGKKQLEKVYSLASASNERMKVVYTRNDPQDRCEIGQALLQKGLTPMFVSQYTPSFLETSFQEYRLALEGGYPVVLNKLSRLSSQMRVSLQMWLGLVLPSEIEADSDSSESDGGKVRNLDEDTVLYPIRRVMFPDNLSLLYVKGSTRQPFSPIKTSDGKFWKFRQDFEFPSKDMLIETSKASPKIGNGPDNGMNSQSFSVNANGEIEYDNDSSTTSSTSTSQPTIIKAYNTTTTKFVPGINPIHFQNLPTYIKDFQNNEDLIVVENFFDQETFDRIKLEAERIWKTNSMEPNCNLDGKDRLGGYVLDDEDREGSFYELIYNNPGLAFWVSSVYGRRMWASDFPVELREYGGLSNVSYVLVELREYGGLSNGMRCHRDLQLFAEEMIDAEFAFTVSNTSPTHEVSFYDKSGKEHRIKPKPNTLLMVRPNASYHCAGPVIEADSERGMMKWIFSGTFRKQRSFEMYAQNDCGSSSQSARGLFEKMSRMKKLENEMSKKEL